MAKRGAIGFLVLLAVLSTIVVAPIKSGAAALSLLADLKYSATQTKTTSPTEDESKTHSHQFIQLYSLKLDRPVFPNLSFRTGGIFQQSNLSGNSDGQSLDSSTRLTQPYLECILTNPLYGADLGYRKNEIVNSSSGILTRDTMNQYTLRLNYRPVDLPRIGVEYLHTTAADEPRTTDSIDDLFSLTSRYSYQAWTFQYFHTTLNHKEKIADTRTTTQTDNGKVGYSNNFLNRKLMVDATLQGGRNAIKFSGGGTQRIQTTPVGSGFFLLQDPSPTENLAGAFTSVDASHPFSTVNLGRGGGSSPLSVGLSFGQPTKLDELQLLLEKDEQDPTLATPGQIAAIAQQFSWRIFVSDDQLTWTEQPVSKATFNVFDNRFEIDLPQVEARYIKIVVVPLYLSAPGEIHVANLTAYISLATGKETQIVSTSGSLTSGVTWKASEKTTVRYDLFLQNQTSDPFGSDQSQLSNAISFNHILTPVFSTRGRLLRTNGWQSGGNSYTYNNYSAGVTGRYLPTFYQTLSYTGSKSQERDGDSTTNAVVLRNFFDLYQGWSLLLDQGYSWQDMAESGKAKTFFLRSSTRLVPNRKMNINIDYTVSWGEEEKQGSTRQQNGRINTFFLPFDTLSLNADLSFSDRRGGAEQQHVVLQNYSANWSPFREGTLQISFLYNQAQIAENHRTTSFSPMVRWQLTRKTLLTFTYSIGKDDNEDDVTHFKTLYAELLVSY